MIQELLREFATPGATVLCGGFVILAQIWSQSETTHLEK